MSSEEKSMPSLPPSSAEFSQDSAESAAREIPAGILEIVERIRADSVEIRLTRLSTLRSAFQDRDAEALIADSQAEDLKKMRGRSETYFFSDRSMTEAYALHLFRIEERDPLRLVADTVRDESRIYPRPTFDGIFLDTPFNMKERELEEVLGRFTLLPDYADIKACRASNGARYLYSTLHLSEAHAESLAEWIEVGQRENP